MMGITKNNANNSRCDIINNIKSDSTVRKLLQLLLLLEDDLEYHDLYINALKVDEVHANQKMKDTTNIKDNMTCKVAYDNQLNQLEKLIATQQSVYKSMSKQCSQLQKKLEKVYAELEERRQLWHHSLNEDSNVSSDFLKEHQFLISEVDDMRREKIRLRDEVNHAQFALDQLRSRTVKEKSVAVLLIKERRHLVSQICATRRHAIQMERLAVEEQASCCALAEGLQLQSSTATRSEATFAKHLLDNEMERDMLERRLNEVERANDELQTEIFRLKVTVNSELPIQCADSPMTPPLGKIMLKHRPTELLLRRSPSLMSSPRASSVTAAKNGPVAPSGLRRPQIVSLGAGVKSSATVTKQLLSNCK